MHEGKFTEDIVNAIIEQVNNSGEEKPEKVKVIVGEVYHLEPEAVKLHFEVITQGTILEGVELDLEEEHMEVECSDCGKSGPVEDHHMVLCSHCDSRNVKPIKGNDVRIAI